MATPTLTVCIDHVAALRNAFGGPNPCPTLAAKTAVASGADAISVRLSENRGAIRHRDIEKIIEKVKAPITLRLAAIKEMVSLAEMFQPSTCCFVAEMKRGREQKSAIDLRSPPPYLSTAIRRLSLSGIKISLFIEPQIEQISAARLLGVACVQLNTQAYANASIKDRPRQLVKLRLAARAAIESGMICNAGNELSYQTVSEVAAIPDIAEVSIGHAVISQSLFDGLSTAVDRFKTLMLLARYAD
jgi:pyridoxine 5-phosphate synthase